MSDAPPEARSFEHIDTADLVRLHTIALAAFDQVCRDGNASAIYRNRLELVCFCQGAALHHAQCLRDEVVTRGIHDFDVWGFFRRHPEKKFPPRWRGERDFGPSRFGVSPNDTRQGRKVDVIGRSIACEENEDPIAAVLRWITCGPGDSPALIRQRPVFVISPGPDMGRMIWAGPPGNG